MLVLLIGRDADLHLDSVLQELRRRKVRTIRLDPERLNPQNTSVSNSWSADADSASIETYAGRIATSEVQGVLCRYAIETLEPTSSEPIIRFKEAEFFAAVRGLLLQIHGARWINEPFQEARADHKTLQLSLAREVGLQVPPTLVSQSRDELLRFSDMHGPCVVKPLSDVGLARCKGAYSNELNPADLDEHVLCSFASEFDASTLHREGVDYSCPVLLQVEVKKQSDLRVTIVDSEVFAAELVQANVGMQSLDVRNAEAADVRPFTLDEKMKSSLIALTSRLGLRYASCDFAYANGELYFLEANVSGNWLWTETLGGLPISSSLADALISEVGAHNRIASKMASLKEHD